MVAARSGLGEDRHGARIDLADDRNGEVETAGEFTRDGGVVGDSAVAYSLAANVTWRPASWLLATLGYRRVVTKNPGMELTMHGPLVALQLVY